MVRWGRGVARVVFQGPSGCGARAVAMGQPRLLFVCLREGRGGVGIPNSRLVVRWSCVVAVERPDES